MAGYAGRSLAAEKSLEASLIELVKIRSSILKGCANCINMPHHQSPCEGRERTAHSICSPRGTKPRSIPTGSVPRSHGLTPLTTLSAGHKQKAAKETLEAHFTPEEQVNLTVMINVINGWNRIAVGFDLWYENGALKAA